MVLAVLAWTLLAHFFDGKKFWRIINLVFLALALLAILYMTIFDRTPSEKHVIIFDAYPGGDYFREMGMNAFLYLPLGLSLPFALEVFPNLKKRGLIAIVAGLTISILTEMVQYVFGVGVFQGTDLIMNTAGAAFGTLAYFVNILISKHSRKNNDTPNNLS